MRAVVYDAFGSVPVLREVADPVPPAGGVVIEVKATGLCRSDWHGWRGHDPDIRLPHVPGHEFAGVIAAVGAGVTGWRVGDRVTAPFICACGTCSSCLAGDQQVCERQEQPGFTHWGSFADLVVVHYAQVNLVRLPNEVSFAAAAALGCRFATSFRAVVDQGRVSAGDWVAVHGCGGVGLSAIMIAVAAGARVVAIDVQPEALALAERLGAVASINAAELTTNGGAGQGGAKRGGVSERDASQDIAGHGRADTSGASQDGAGNSGAGHGGAGHGGAGHGGAGHGGAGHGGAGHGGAGHGGAGQGGAEGVAGAVREVTGGGAHVSLDALGSQDTLAASVLGLRRRGRHVQVGLLSERPVVPMERVIGWELELVGSHGMPAHAYEKLVPLVATGRLRPAELVTGELALTGAAAALAAMDAPGPTGIRVIVP